MTERHLAGNGVELVRERAMAKAVQAALERMYQLDRVADVEPFVEHAAAMTNEGEREALFVREHGDGTIEMSLRLPRLGSPQLDVERDGDLDPLCQIIEGVSHFVYLADRARASREATQLELELQAEVDKYVVLAAAVARNDGVLEPRQSAALRARLYERVVFAHAAGSEIGERYRIANDLAHGFVRRLEREYVAKKRFGEMRAELRRFYRHGQEEKLRLGRAA